MGAEFQNILLDLSEGVATLTLNRPDRLNSFTEAMHVDLRDALLVALRLSALRQTLRQSAATTCTIGLNAS